MRVRVVLTVLVVVAALGRLVAVTYHLLTGIRPFPEPIIQRLAWLQVLLLVGWLMAQWLELRIRPGARRRLSNATRAKR